MPRGFLSARIDHSNPLHHLWCNNGTWWTHYTLHFGHRKRRIRRSLKTSSAEEAIRRRDALFARIAQEGEEVPERRPKRRKDNPRLLPPEPPACRRPTGTEDQGRIRCRLTTRA